MMKEMMMKEMMPQTSRNATVMLCGACLLVFLTGCAQNRAKIVYSSPPVPGPTIAANSSSTVPSRLAPDDATLTDHLQDALIQDRRIRATNVRVSVRRHVITLQGVLNSEAAKEAAAQDCLAVPGVATVENQIAVEPEG